MGCSVLTSDGGPENNSEFGGKGVLDFQISGGGVVGQNIEFRIGEGGSWVFRIGGRGGMQNFLTAPPLF